MGNLAFAVFLTGVMVSCSVSDLASATKFAAMTPTEKCQRYCFLDKCMDECEKKYGKCSK